MPTFREDIIAFIKSTAVTTAKVCEKFGYGTRQDAERHLAHLNSRPHHQENKKQSNMVDAYECQKCGLWHLGHNTFANNRRFRRSTQGRNLKLQ